MNKILIILILILNSFLAFSQANDEEQNIYNAVLEYYFLKYHNDSTKTILLIDSTKTIDDKSLNAIIEITRKFYDGNFYSYYHDYLDVDTSNINNIEKLNRNFHLRSLEIAELSDLLGKYKNISFVKKSYLDSIFHPYRSINSYNNRDSVANVLKNCWFKLTSDMNCLGYCSFSRPYIIDHNKALIYFSFMQGSMAGMSAVYILKKESNVWKVKKIITIAIS